MRISQSIPKFLLSAVLMCCAILAFSQVQNSGFEDYSALPASTGQWQLADGWSNAGSMTASPDYYHSNGTLAGDLPETPLALVDPFEGSAIMGFVATGVKGTNYREYLSNPLLTALESGKKYQVTFYITNGLVTEMSPAGLGTSHLGVRFSINPLAQSGNAPLERQNVLFDRDWIEFSFSFVADDNFNHFTLGVFGNDDEKHIEVNDGNAPQLAYYFVDDFKVVEIPNGQLEVEDGKGNSGSPDDNPQNPLEPFFDGAQFFIPNAFTPNEDGDNDIFLPVSPNLDVYDFRIYNRWGQLLFISKDASVGWDGRNEHGNMAETGTYIWEISYTEVSDDQEPIEKQLNGTINLMR
jgi:gliding motility-associated-like protein